MHYYLIIFSLAAYSSAWWPVLPGLPYATGGWLATLFLAYFLAWNNRVWRGLFAVASGTLWAAFWGHWLLSDVLPISKDKSDYYVSGVVSGIPEQNERSTRFIFEVDSVSAVDAEKATFAKLQSGKFDDNQVPTLKRLQINWYGAAEIRTGQRWQFVVRLRSPRGFANPGGFDYRLWLLRKGISATGYVRQPEQALLLQETGQYSIDRYRQRIRASIVGLELDELSKETRSADDTAAKPLGRGPAEPVNFGLSNTAKSLLVALTIGDKRSLSGQLWQQLRVTGTIHLLIISGLHIGMAAAVGMLVGSLLGRCLSALGFNTTRIQVGATFAWAFAIIYAAMADFSLPTQRAMVMLSVLLLALVWKRSLRPWLAFIWALSLQALIDPLAALSAGFWLSYGIVAVFIWYFSTHPRVPWIKDWKPVWVPRRVVQGQSLWSGKFRCARWLGKPFFWLQTLLETQLLVLLMLSGALIYFQGSVSLLAPLINLLALPWFSIFIVPLALLGVLVFPVSPTWAEGLWWLAARQLQYFGELLNHASLYSRYATWTVATDQYLIVAMAVSLAGAFLLAPRGLGLRLMSGVLIVALTQIIQPKGPLLEVVVLDVGQGLSVVVLSRDHLLVYDAGRKYSDNFDIGSAVVAPYLRSRGIKTIDVLVVSHSDADHSGGVTGLLSEFDAQRIIAGQPDQLQLNQLHLRQAGSTTPEQCREGLAWRWGEVEFEVIHPDHSLQDSDNNSSCVMTIRTGQQTVLLTGDIEADVETKLLRKNKLPLNINLLVAPHHGSISSSTKRFVAAIAPQHVVYSAGFNHHFGHPHPTIVQRYALVNAQQWSTGTSGALSFQWRDKEDVMISRARDSVQGYWHEPLPAAR